LVVAQYVKIILLNNVVSSHFFLKNQNTNHFYNKSDM